MFLEGITARLSNIVNEVISDGNDLEFNSNRPPANRGSEQFVFCFSKSGIGIMERGYKRFVDRLHALPSPKKSHHPKLSREISISRN